MTSASAIAAQSIILPKGGGAVRGIGETFQPNLFSGTGNHSIPIAVTPGRNGFGPSLNLQYSSGNGNGVFGLGWELPIPRITRKTEKGIPQYDDSDVFVMSGAEDLVPCLEKSVDPLSGQVSWRASEPTLIATHVIHRYRPRTEGAFARIERWVNNLTGVEHWRAITRDNVTSVFGANPESRIADPDNPRRVYQWLLQETFDSFGNHIAYEYARDNPSFYSHDQVGLGLTEIFEQNRNPAQLYVRRICYGNLPSPLVDEQGGEILYPSGDSVGVRFGSRRYTFEIVFDYGDWPFPTLDPHPSLAAQQELFGTASSSTGGQQPMPIREDRFSSFRAGFEVRTLRRCRRVLMFHHFAELGGPTLVRSTDFTYKSDPNTCMSLLVEAAVTSFDRDSAGAYRSASLPPVTFAYTEFKPHEQHYQSIEALGADMPPMALNHPDVALVDLFGDGLPDVVHSGTFGFRYWRNLGHGLLDRPRSLSHVPASAALRQRGVGFGDIGGDGQTDLLVHTSPLPGFYETTSGDAWRAFRPYASFPSFDLDDPNVRLVDLTGDGRSDALMTQAEQFAWFECLGEQGYAPPRFIPRRHDFDQFPDVFFDDPAGRVRLADMSGDGLSDIVMIQSGRIDYWPNLGYGRFGPRVTMSNSPLLEADFNPRRLFLADLNGTGCADLIYVDFDRVHFWFNQSGNQWSSRETIVGTPLASKAESIQLADFFGTGTGALLWSEDFTAQPESHYKALDFCGGVKPYVLNAMSNNMGATTKVRYAPSTKYFLEDQANGTPWITRLPFPVQVVDTVEVIDHISKTKLVTTYKYHHGYYDGGEREFRGFGRVDQLDTQTFEEFTGSSLHGDGAAFINNANAFHAPPVETRSWFHTGIYFDEDSAAASSELFDFRELSEQFRREYYQADVDAIPLGEHEVESNGAPHEAFRALRGAVLRTEVYSRDGGASAVHPYMVTENRHRIAQLQPNHGNHHGVYFAHQLESLGYHYERQPSDPRVSHSLTLEIDDVGNPLRSIAIGYGRRLPDPGLPNPADQDKQLQSFVTYTENSFTNKVDDPALDLNNYRTPLPSESRTFELTGFSPADNASQFSLDELRSNDFVLLNNAEAIPYESIADPNRQQKRLIEHVRTYYRKNDLNGLLPLGSVESLALPGETHKLALTPGLLSQVYGDRVTNETLEESGYFSSENDSNWWIPSGRSFFSPDEADTPEAELAFAHKHFFLPHRSQDPFGNSGVVHFDPYALLSTRAVDALGNRIQSQNNYRLMQPHRVTDPNGNRSEVAFDTLGLVVGTALMGKETETLGDSLTGFVPDLSGQERQSFLADPRGTAADLLRGASIRIVYDLDRFRETGQPSYAAVLAREMHLSDPLPPHGLKIQVGLTYSDGFGREIQKKIQAEPGPISEGGPIVNPRWVGSGWTIFNNKAKPVKKFEPFYDDTHEFRFGNEVGISSTQFYDPIDRVVATLHPNHTWEKVVFDAWRQESWDVNDTVLIADPTADPDVGGYFGRLSESDYSPTWHGLRTDPAHAAEFAIQYPDAGNRGRQTLAAAKTELHAATPSIGYSDSLGRTFLTVVQNRFVRQANVIDEQYATRVQMDIEGNQREVVDALDRIVMRYDYDMLGTRIHQASMEAGERWMLNDVAGNPIRSFDSRGHSFATRYDALRRLVGQTVAGTTTDSDPRTLKREILVDKIEYGEGLPHAESLNLRGRIYRHFDSAGVVTNARLDANGDPAEAYDFKGNLLRSTRRLASDYKAIPDWRHDVQLDAEFFEGGTRYDALNRPIQAIAPHSSLIGAQRNVIQPVYNEANLLERLNVWLERATEPVDLLNPTIEAASAVGVGNIEYNAKGQRERIDYKNGASTFYNYDPLTFRLIQLYTRRGVAFTEDCENPTPPPPTIAAPDRPSSGKACGLQNLHYTFDPAGNITHIEDRAQPTIYFKNQMVSASNDYIYDAVYRLIEATGREHLGQAGAASFPVPHSHNDAPRIGLLNPGDGNAMGRYVERYTYDAVGNFVSMQHRGTDSMHAGWTRSYSYNEPNLIEPSKPSNRLSNTMLGTQNAPPLIEPYSHDIHGNMTSMPHLPLMRWEFRDQLQATSRQVVSNGGTPEITHYVYDSAGQRVRKVTESQAAPGQTPTRLHERVYMGGFEIYLEYENDGDTVSLERETLHILDDQQRIALVETQTQGIGPAPRQLIRYQFVNHLGSSTLELDDDALIITYEEFTPYGSTSYQAVRNQNDVPKRYRYTGMERDEESGLCSHGARYYASWLGRWSSCDPIGIGDGLNVFSYAKLNPVSYSDTNGCDSSDQTRDSEVKELDHWYSSADRNRDQIVTGTELEEKLECTTVEYSARLMYLMKHDSKRYTVFGTPKTNKWLNGPTENSYEQNENAPRYNSEGGIYTNREGREATKRRLNRHRNPERLWETVKFGAAVVFPEYYFASSSIYHSATGDPAQAALDLGGVLLFRYGKTPPRAPRSTGQDARASIQRSSTAEVMHKSTTGEGMAGESLAPHKAQQLLGANSQRVFVVGPEGPSSTRAIRFSGNRITYDTRAPGHPQLVREDMAVINNMMNSRGGTWWTGTHGTPYGDFGGIGNSSLLNETFYLQERTPGYYRGFQVRNVAGESRTAILGQTLTQPTVYSWCYSSSCFLK